jgi:hypothetical protein
MGARVFAAALTPDRLTEVATELRSDAPFAILERLDDLVFPASDVVPPVAEWDKGWLFGSTLELRWERQGTTFRVIFTLTDDRGAPSGFGEPIQTLPDGGISENDYYLWGEDDPSVGRQLIYRALPPGGRAKLVVQEFRDPDSAELLFYRYVCMRREK